MITRGLNPLPSLIPHPSVLSSIPHPSSLSFLFSWVHSGLNAILPVLGLGLGVDFTLANNNKNNNNNNNPHLIFHRRKGTRGLKFSTQT